MKKFHSKKQNSNKFPLFLFSIFFIGGFFLAFSFFMNPKFIINYIKETYLMSKNNNITTWYINETLGKPKNLEEEDMGTTKYIPDPNPVENQQESIIYIYNTHQTEEYYINLLMEHDIVPSVMTSSYILREKLNARGLKSMVETTNIMDMLKNENLNYASSYQVSRKLMEDAYNKNPTLTYFIDLHRDSIPYESSTLVLDKMTYAKALFVIGTDNPNYLQNKAFAEQISNQMNSHLEGISRGILEKGGENSNGIYNQDFNDKTILIEIGSSYNTIMEVTNTIEILAQSISEVIKGDS